MRAIALFSKRQHGLPVVAQDKLILRRGDGIEGDVNAIVGSPRQVLLVGTPSLEQFDLQPGDLRENVLVDEAIEALPSGQVLQIGQDALIRLTCLCEPCAYLENLQRELARQLKGKRGRLGMVVRQGVIRPGEAIVVANHQFPEIPDTAKGRFTEFVARIPSGKVVRTPELLIALGLTRGYYRAIPAFLKKAVSGLPVHRIVAADGSLLLNHLPRQEQLLAAEGLEIIDTKISSNYSWQPIHFHDLGSF